MKISHISMYVLALVSGIDFKKVKSCFSKNNVWGELQKINSINNINALNINVE